MSRIMLVSGVHLDRAWPELGSAFGRVLREWSREALVRTVERAREHQVSALVVVGGLMDRPMVLPDTVEFTAADAWRVLDAGGATVATGTYAAPTSGSNATVSAAGVQFTLTGQPAVGDRFVVERAPVRDVFA